VLTVNQSLTVDSPVSLVNSSVIVNGGVNVSSNLSLTNSQILVSGDLVLSQSSTSEFVVTNTSGVPIVVTNCIAFSGTLEITLPPDYDLSKNLEVASYSCFTGKFTSIVLDQSRNCRIIAIPSYLMSTLEVEFQVLPCDAESRHKISIHLIILLTSLIFVFNYSYDVSD